MKRWKEDYLKLGRQDYFSKWKSMQERRFIYEEGFWISEIA